MSSADKIFASAERFADAEDWGKARAAYLQVLEIEPSHADAALQLSYLESFTGHYRAAREWAVRAASAGRRLRPESMLELIRRLRTFNEIGPLRQLAERLVADSRAPQAALVECARQLSNLSDPAAALLCATVAVDRNPADLAARLVHGQLLAQYGNVTGAEQDFNWVAERAPTSATPWWLLSRLRRQTTSANHVAHLQSLLGRPGLPLSEVATLARALHKELDDLGDFEGAWRALEVLCRARRQEVRYDPRSTRALVDGLVRWTAASTECGSEHSRTPVFIVGMHRSGTTLLEQLLDVSPQVRGLGELYDFTAAMRYVADHHGKGTVDSGLVERAANLDFGQVGARYMEAVASRLGEEPFFCDKQPSNFLNVGFICKALPGARILHLVRDPVETCFSNLRELFSGINEYSYDQLELADYFLQYRRLMAHWHEAFPGRILDVPYDELTGNTEATMRAVVEYCGIDYLPSMCDPRNNARAVSTASGVQVRDHVIKRDAPKWAPYARHLQPLIGALRDGGLDV